ncbi:Tyrosine recombinase XerD [Bacillus sp. ZZV12-4809]|nr:Tyrosine recombinase XerD [Bacillus sp. ZZV12-4809]
MRLPELYRTFIGIKSAEGRSPQTMQQYHDNYTGFTRFLEHRGIADDSRNLNRHVIREYILYMRSDLGYKPATVNTRLKTLRVIFKTLVDEDLIDRNPMDGVKSIQDPLDKIDVLTVDELKRLLNAPDKSAYAGYRDYTLMHVLVDSMMRIGEATQLKVQDFDLTQATVTVPATVAKSRKYRTLPLKPITTRLVKRLIEANDDFGTEYVFLTNYGEPINRDHFRKRLYEYATTAGLKKRVHPHLLRHTSATLFLEDGGDIRHLQMLLGHADMRMVQRYTHLSDRALREQHAKHSAIDKVSSKLSRPRKRKL